MIKHTIKDRIISLTVIIFGALLGLLIKPDLFEKYYGQLMSDNSQLLADGQKIYYADIDNDGNSEEFIYYHLSDNRQPVINQYSSEGEFQKAWYLEGEIVENFDFISGDYNNDNINEVYVFSKDNKAIYLYGLDHLTGNEFIVYKIPVCQIGNSIENKHLVIHAGVLHYLNKDGFKDVVFSINSRYNKSPRRVIAFDIKKNHLMQSAELGLQLVGLPIIYDIDKDGSPEIFLSTLNNTNKDWVGPKEQNHFSSSIILRANLAFYTVPLLFENRMSVTSTFPYVSNNTNYIGVLSWPLHDNQKSRIMLLSSKGEVIKQRSIDPHNFVFDPLRNDWSQFLTFSRNGKIMMYDVELNQTEMETVKGIINQVAFIDLDNDLENEIILVQNNQLAIYRQNFDYPVHISIPGLSVQRTYFSVKRIADQQNLLSVQSENHHYLVSYSYNKLYWLRFLLIMATALAAYFVYWLLIKIQLIRVERIKLANERFYQMQFDLIRNQLDPHFLFNALNSIAFSINKDDRKTAYSNLGLFSKFMREAIVSIDEFTRTLEEEIDYVKNYLTLEKFRFKQKFSYDFIISPGINKSVKVPRLIIFSFTESALKKGILMSPINGRIIITIDETSKQGVYIAISDDGMHRNFMNSKNSYSKNMLMMEQVVDYFNATNDKKITIQIKDNGTIENPKGSTVEIFIPADYQYLV